MENRWTENTRQYDGEAEAKPLVAWLNYPLDPGAANYQANKESQTRIAQILDWLLELGAAGGDEVEKCISLRDRINEALRECAMVPQVWLLPGKELSCALDLMPAPGSQYAEPMASGEIGKMYELLGGHHEILRLVNIWRNGNIASLRRCKNCEKFIYKRFPQQEFCGAPARCREAFYKRSEEYKVERRERDRRNYRFKVRK
jgi:hypothetical protein